MKYICTQSNDNSGTLLSIMYIILVNCHVLFELVEKLNLVLHCSLYAPFQIQGCFSQNILKGHWSIFASVKRKDQKCEPAQE